MKNFLTIDVEDYFQVSAFEDIVSKAQWSGYESRVVANTCSILDIFDKVQVHATFFIVGWVAENFPEIVRNIQDKGHEIGCHSYWHRKVYDLSPEEFREDTKRAKEVIENITGRAVRGYRAPSYSITQRSMWALNILSQLGFEYDSSIFPVVHDNYGIPGAPRFRFVMEGERLVEFPITTAKILGVSIPVAGGGYFRLFPYWFSKALLARINRREQQSFMFYLHPWEIDPRQPRMGNASLLSNFRHYNNLDKTLNRFKRLLDDFQFGPVCDAING